MSPEPQRGGADDTVRATRQPRRKIAMALVSIHDNALVIRFARWERLFAARASMTVPLAAVRAVACADRPLAATRGARWVGMFVTGVVKIGSWGTGTRTRQFVCVRRGVPGLRVVLDRRASGLRFDELLISTAGAADLARAIEQLRAAA
jgi:hypothetical protein